MSDFKKNKRYVEPDLTLNSLSKMIKIKPYKISRAINLETQQSFSQFTNKLRVDKAIQILSSKKTKKQNILNVSYDCGFNSLSAFNAAFKKFTNQTPSEFKPR